MSRNGTALEFLPGITEKLGWYVYALRDPRENNAIFYVGKGVGGRRFVATAGLSSPIGEDPSLRSG